MASENLIASIPLGYGGLTGSKNLATILPHQLLDATNITYEEGTIRKEGGSVKYNSAAISGTPKILGGWDWIPSSGVQRMIVYTDDGELLKDTGSGDFTVTLDTALNTDVIPMFVAGGKEAAANNRKLFMFNGKNAVQVLSGDGATTADLSTPPADWTGNNQPLFGLVHEGRLWGGGNLNDPHRLYYSTTADHEDVSGGGTISVFPGEGEYLVGAVSFKGVIVAFKYPTGIYVIDTTDPTIANWKVSRLTQHIGAAGSRGITLIDNDILFLDTAGNFQLVSGIQEFGNLGSRNLSQIAEMGTFIRENVNLNRLKYVKAIYYPTKREAHFALARSGSIVNDARLVIDFNNLQLPRFRFSTKDVAESLWLRQETDSRPRLICGDDAGFVWKLDDETRSRDGLGYVGSIQTPHTDLSFVDPGTPALATRRKEGKFLEIIVAPLGNWDLSADILWDGVLVDTITFSMGHTGASLGDFELDTDVLTGSQVLSKKKRITGGGRRFSVIFRNSGAGEDFALAGAYLHFTMGDERG